MYTPFPYQIQCLDALCNHRKERNKNALVVMASGLGKTVTSALDAKQWIKERGEKGKILYLCHQNEILEQAQATFHSILGNDLTYGYFHGYEKDFNQVNCLFASLQTMFKYYDNAFIEDEFDYIVVDESHHSHAETFNKVIKYFTPEFLLGITATPERMDDKDIRDIYGEIVFNLPLPEALAQGYLTPVDYRVLQDEIDLSKINIEDKNLNKKMIDRSIFIPKRDEEIGKIIQKNIEAINNPKVIVFCSSIKHCNNMAYHLPHSLPIHSKINNNERRINLELFRQGFINTVLTVDCFNEGVDIPQANILVFLRSTASKNIFFQQLGRGLRIFEGKSKVLVLDFVANCDRIDMIYSAWKDIEEHQERINYGDLETADREDPRAPFTIDLDSVGFTERIVKIIEIIREKNTKEYLSKYPKLVEEYMDKNERQISQLTSGSNYKAWWKCSECEHEWQARVSRRVSGKSGCKLCKGDLLMNYPKLAEEYMDKNKKHISKILISSNEKVWWKCSECEHEWEIRVRNRKKYGCPSCSRRAVTHTNNLLYTHPKLAEEYMPPPHNELPANKIVSGGKKKVWWKCSECEHEWEALITERKRGSSNCPNCNPNKNIPAPNSNLKSRFPDLAKEYMPPPHNELPACEVLPYQKRKIKWKCSKCEYEWIVTLVTRVRGRGNCPNCKKIKRPTI